MFLSPARMYKTKTALKLLAMALVFFAIVACTETPDSGNPKAATATDSLGLAPAEASAPAIARPIPRLAPVTIAVFPVSSVMSTI